MTVAGAVIENEQGSWRGWTTNPTTTSAEDLFHEQKYSMTEDEFLNIGPNPPSATKRDLIARWRATFDAMHSEFAGILSERSHISTLTAPGPADENELAGCWAALLKGVSRASTGTAESDEVDPTIWRGIFVPPFPRRVLFTAKIPIGAGKLRRRTPVVTIDRRMLDDDDD